MIAAIRQSAEIRSRGDFANYCNQNRLLEAVEVGTDRGSFAVEFLSAWKGFTLLCVDPYESYPNMPWPRDMDRAVALQRLANFGDRVRFIPWPSPAAASKIHSEWHIHFVYIDGAHDYDSVMADLQGWWNRLDPGGLIAGHDWVGDNGVVRAVKDFFTALPGNHVIYTTSDRPASWYVAKPRR